MPYLQDVVYVLNGMSEAANVSIQKFDSRSLNL